MLKIEKQTQKNDWTYSGVFKPGDPSVVLGKQEDLSRYQISARTAASERVTAQEQSFMHSFISSLSCSSFMYHREQGPGQRKDLFLHLYHLSNKAVY